MLHDHAARVRSASSRPTTVAQAGVPVARMRSWMPFSASRVIAKEEPRRRTQSPE